jgi:pro-kumamolisin-like protein
MSKKLGFASFSFILFSILLSSSSAVAQQHSGRHARVLVTQHVDEGKRVTLHGNTRPEAKHEHDRGPVHGHFRMEHMLLQLRRSPEQELALQQFIDELHTQGSPNFHRWISAEEFGERFGVAEQDLDAVVHWLESDGFEVNVVYPSGMVIDFSGTVAQVRKAFQTDIRHFEFNGKHHKGNNSDPQIPAALAPVIAGVVSLHDFQPHALYRMHQPRPNFTFTDSLGGTDYAVVPADLATIYNLNPLFSSGLTGTGQTIVLIEDTNLFTNVDWTKFRSTFGLSSYASGSLKTVHPAPSSGTNNCANPGVVSPNDAEAILDAEWASAAAPNAGIRMATCADTTTTFGGLIALQNLINSTSQPPAIMSISYGQCETVNGAAANQAYYSAYQQAVAEGVSVFVASGDSGAAGCDNSVAQATNGIGVNAFASTPYNVAVGGTDFSDSFAGTNSLYWNSTNTSTFGSARSYIPEIPWNDSCAGTLISSFAGYPNYGPDSLCNSPLGSILSTTVAGGGGPSGCATGSPFPANSGIVSGTCQGWAKPSWQSILGNPNDGVRDTPDVSLFAADGLWGHFYVFCWSHTSQGGAACTGNPSGWSGAGGTSFSAPIMAGIQALVNQKVGARQGNPNPSYYQLAANEYSTSAASSCNSSNGNTVPGSCVFYDVTLGDMDVNCTGSANCYLAGASMGVLSTSNSSFNPAYAATTGWDFATGIGTLNAANLVNNWPTPSSMPVLSISKSHSGSFTRGQLNATYSVVVSDAFNGVPTAGTVTVTETIPSGLTLVSMAGAGWACSANTCSRSDALNPGASYPAITVTVNVAANATSPQVNQASVSGGGSASASASDSTTIVIPIPPAVATFVAADTTTQGNWKGVYGADGYSIANDSQSIPAYATFAMQNQFSYTWAASTTDPRALQTGSGTGRIASTWYFSGTFTFDVNTTDGNLHQFALYALDWDANGRSETFQVLDANTNAVLDTRTLSGFSNGVYLVWNLSGHVKINVIWTGGVNAVVSGAFFGGPGSGGTETVNVSPQNVTLIASQQQQFTATVTGTPNQAVTWSIASVSPASADPGSISAAGLYTAPATITPAQVTIKATSADGTASSTAKVTLIASAAASFVSADTATQGNWHGVYGTDGYSIANDSQSIPPYATFAVQNASTFTWTANTTDPRALQTGSGTGRIASTWYLSGTFTFDVNLTDGHPHQFALYALDWDANGRTETIQILDANTNAILDTRTISSFSNGVYLVWNLSGHVKINVLWTGGINAVVSGAFFGSTSGGGTETVSVNPQTVNLTAGQQQQFAASVTGTANQAVTWSIASVAPATAAPGTISATGLYTAPATVTSAQVTIKATSADGTASGTAKVTLVATTSANFVAADTTTQGNWHGVYGLDGFSIANDSQSIPAYATFAVQNAFTYTWVPSTTDPRALQNGAGTDRLASTWYLSGTFTYDVNLTDGNPHQFALYAVDWDLNGRTETVQIVDANTNAVLDTRTLSSFSNGVYLVWNVTGHVKVNVTWTSGINAVVSGVFFK